MNERAPLHVLVVLASTLLCCGGPSAKVAPIAPPTPSVATSTSSTTTTQAKPSDAERFAALRDRLVAQWLADAPSWARQLGFHEYDGKVADCSAAAVKQHAEGYAQAIVDLDAIPAASLSEDDALDQAILRRIAARARWELVDADQSRKEPQFYEDLFSVEQYVDRAYAPIEGRLARLVEQEEAALAQVGHVRENLVLPLSKIVAKIAGRNYLGFADYLRTDVVKVFAGVGDAALQARFAKANGALAKEAQSLGEWLQKEVAPKGDDSHVLGVDRYRKLLEAQEGLTLSLAEFTKMGEDDLAANKKAYEALAKTVKLTRPKASELLAEATRVMDDARNFVVEHHVITLASDDAAVVKETPPYARWNAASLDASGPFDPYRIAFYYVTLPDPTWPKKEQDEYVLPNGMLVTTTVHEVYPGHFVQGRWQERAPTKVQKLSWSYSFGEGWAHYTEQMMIEEGFRASDQTRLGMYGDALLRDCRFVVSIGMHTAGLTVEQAAKRFVDDCHQDAATAREQAERGTFDPGYFAYTLGKLQILALRDDAKKALGAKFSLQRFHDALLSHGAPPVTLIRARVLRDLGAAS